MTADDAADEVARLRRCEAARAEYRRLRDLGQKRRLVRTVDGELTLYRPEEIGFVRGGPAYAVRTVRGLWVGVWVLAGFSLAFVAVFIVSATQGRPFWGALPLAIVWAGLSWIGLTSIRKEKRAAELRRRRGIPAPSRFQI
ncbi:hypothetical protein [Micromonospora sp. NPDC050200]|uniref:hypothetical protein n=1 Tax=Micromonospora sp. NPDC050200 TaxID=3155664 RepID=UPI0033C75B7C